MRVPSGTSLQVVVAKRSEQDTPELLRAKLSALQGIRFKGDSDTQAESDSGSETADSDWGLPRSPDRASLAPVTVTVKLPFWELTTEVLEALQALPVWPGCICVLDLRGCKLPLSARAMKGLLDTHVPSSYVRVEGVPSK